MLGLWFSLSHIFAKKFASLPFPVAVKWYLIEGLIFIFFINEISTFSYAYWSLCVFCELLVNISYPFLAGLFCLSLSCRNFLDSDPLLVLCVRTPFLSQWFVFAFFFFLRF